MKAAVLNSPQDVLKRPLQIVDVPRPEFVPGHVLLRVRACGVCRTDLHIVEGELPPRRDKLIPGHQIVGDIVDGATAEFPIGTRVGVSWIGGIDGTCWYCTQNLENLCDNPIFTGYTVNGGYAEYALARSDFVFALPSALDDLQAAPLLCAGIIGFRSLGASSHRGSSGLEMRGLRFHPRRFASKTGTFARSYMGWHRGGQTAGRTRPSDHFCTERRRGYCSAGQPAQR